MISSYIEAGSLWIYDMWCVKFEISQNNSKNIKFYKHHSSLFSPYFTSYFLLCEKPGVSKTDSMIFALISFDFIHKCTKVWFYSQIFQGFLCVGHLNFKLCFPKYQTKDRSLGENLLSGGIGFRWIGWGHWREIRSSENTVASPSLFKFFTISIVNT